MSTLIDAKVAPSTPECAFCIFTTVHSEKVQNADLPTTMKAVYFHFIFLKYVCALQTQDMQKMRSAALVSWVKGVVRLMQSNCRLEGRTSSPGAHCQTKLSCFRALPEVSYSAVRSLPSRVWFRLCDSSDSSSHKDGWQLVCGSPSHRVSFTVVHLHLGSPSQVIINQYLQRVPMDSRAGCQHTIFTFSLFSSGFLTYSQI